MIETLRKQQLSDYYNEIYSNSDEYVLPYDKSPYYCLWKNVLKFINDKSIILDIGCGTGQFAKMLEDNNFVNYTGIDISDVAINIAKTNSKQKFLVMDANYAIKNVKYNTVIAQEFFEHIDNDIDLINNINQSIHIIFTVPDFDDIAHIRFFKTFKGIVDRYEDLISINLIQKIDRWYLINGYKK